MPDKCTEPCADLTRLEKELDKFQGQNSDTHREIFKRLNELYATTGQVGFLASQRVDGRLILPEALKVLKQKAGSGS